MAETCTVYWAPVFIEATQNWNMIYPDLTSVHERIRPYKTSTKSGNFFYCPSFTGLAENTFVLENPIAGSYKIVNNQVGAHDETFINAWTEHASSMEGYNMLSYGMKWVFFTEEDIEMMLVSPFFGNAEHLKYGNVMPGKLNISKWFRYINLEYILHKGVKEFKVNKGESLAYVVFNTNKKVNLKRFEMNDKLHSYGQATGTSTTWEPWVPLATRYKRFMESRTNKLVLNEIKKNLVDTDTQK
jgi:hypothetical protein